MNKILYIILLLLIGQIAYSQKTTVGDNLGNHIATDNLNMGGKNIKNLQPIELNADYADSILCISGGVVKKQGTNVFLPNLSDYLRMSIIPSQTITGPVSLTGPVSFSKDISIGAINGIGGINVGVGIGAQTSNIAIGYQALNSNYALKSTDGRYNIAIGYNALSKNDNSSTDNMASNNTAIGYNVGSNITKSNGTTILGSGSGTGITIGDNNTIIGFRSGINITSGKNNIMVGANSGGAINTGNYNTIIGSANVSTEVSNNIIIADGQGNMGLQIDGLTGISTFIGQVIAPSIKVTGSAGVLQSTGGVIGSVGVGTNGQVLTNTSGTVGWATPTITTSSTYTPDVINVSGTTVLSVTPAIYIRVGNNVNVSFSVSGTCTESVNNQFSMTIPVGNNFISPSQGFGMGANSSVSGNSLAAAINSISGTKTMLFSFNPIAAQTTFNFFGSFQYIVQ